MTTHDDQLMAEVSHARVVLAKAYAEIHYGDDDYDTDEDEEDLLGEMMVLFAALVDADLARLPKPGPSSSREFYNGVLALYREGRYTYTEPEPEPEPERCEHGCLVTLICRQCSPERYRL